MLGTDVNMITRLKVIGPINGTDLRTLREMAGVDFYGNTTSGQLRELDLTQATICSGGDDYMEHWDSDNIANSIPVACFMYSNLVSVSLPINLKSIENQAFFWCEKLENVVIPSTCRRIGMNAFGVTSLASIDIPRGVGDIGIKAFDRCYNLKSINVHADNISYSSVNGILCDDAMETLLYYPSGKGEINIPDNVKYIDESAFDDCVRSKSLFIPANVVTIPSKACMYMSQLSSIEVDINNKYYTSIDGVLYSKNVTDLVACPKLKESLVIPESVQFISSYACWKCANLREVKMHDNISVIGENAFYECTNLADIVFSSNLINIDASAFFNCTRLTTISLPKSLSSLGNAAFCGCENLMVIYSWRDFPPLIGDNAFSGCSSLSSVEIPSSVISIGDAAFSGAVDFVMLKSETPVAVGNGVFSSAFSKIAHEVTFVVPGGSVEAYREAWSSWCPAAYICSDSRQHDWEVTVVAEDNASGLLNAIAGGMDDEVMWNVFRLKISGTINSYDFMIMRNKMLNLRYLDLSEAQVVYNAYEHYQGYHSNDNELPGYAFYRSNLMECKLPKNLTCIGGSAFEGCLLRNIVIPESVEVVGHAAFSLCRFMEDVQFPSTLKV